MSVAQVMKCSTDSSRWDAVKHRDRRADGVFLYGVKTTGVYCRPACSSRLPNRGNIAFFTSAVEAERAGFRACRRCKPRTKTAGRAAPRRLRHAGDLRCGLRVKRPLL